MTIASKIPQTASERMLESASQVAILAPNDALFLLAKTAAELLSCQKCILFDRTPDARELNPITEFPTAEQQDGASAFVQLADRLFRNSNATDATKTKESKPADALDPGIETALAVPIRFREENFGLLVAVNKQGSAEFDESDHQILAWLATQAAIVIRLRQNSDIRSEIERQITELERKKTDFIAIASHELRTPLGLILGHATFLREIANHEAYIQQISTIVNNAEKLKAVIEELTQIDNLQSGTARIRREAIELDELLELITNKLAPKAAENQISLFYARPDQGCWTEGEPQKLSIALENIVENAILYNNSGGKAEICLEILKTFAKITIIDNGIGIPEEYLDRIFERFFQVESHLTRRRGGMGLGLAVAKATIESHGGHIWVESVQEHGSKFSVLLPLKTDNLAPSLPKQLG